MDVKNANSASRRKFLKTAGKFAVYTPPALMLMTKPGHTEFTVSVICKPGYGFGDKNHLHCGPPGQQKNGEYGMHITNIGNPTGGSQLNIIEYIKNLKNN